MIMKRIYMMALAAVLLMPVMAEPKGASVALSVVVEDMVEPFPATAKAQMQSKLTKLLTQNGVASLDYMGQFFITAMAVPQQKEVLAGPPVQIAEVMDVVFYIADYQNKTVFATTSVSTKGVGSNETKSYMDGLKRLNLNSPALKAFVEKGRAKIVDYYNSRAEAMFAEAQSLANRKEYERAIWLVTLIPSECEKYKQSLALADTFYQGYIDRLCQENLAAAKAVWAASQNAEGAALAGEYLANILPDAGCYAEAEKLYREIKGKVLDDWHFEMKKYQDAVDLEADRINAIREVGVAYGKGQQPTTTNIGFLH